MEFFSAFYLNISDFLWLNVLIPCSLSYYRDLQYAHNMYASMHNLWYLTDVLKKKPTRKILRRVKQSFAHQWKDIAYELLVNNDAEVKIIDSSSKCIVEKCFDMLEKWLETSSNPCYYDLIKALEQHNLYAASENVKMEAAAERD